MADLITPFISDVLTCVCTRLATDGRPVCECCHTVGEPVMDGCDCVCPSGQGRAWITFLGGPFLQQGPSKCPTGVWAINFLVGVWRCVSHHEGLCVASTADSLLVAADTASVLAALQCCPAFEGQTWEITRFDVIGPSGGCVGVSASFTVQFPTLIA